MKQQIFKKHFLKIIFLFVLLIIPFFQVDARLLELEPIDGGGGGGTTPPAYTPPPAVYGSISLTVDIGSTGTYTGSDTVVAKAGALVNTCSNTTSEITVTAQIVDMSGNAISGQSAVNIISASVTGGSNTGEKTGNLTAPTTAGNYKLRFTANRYDPSGYVLYNRANWTTLGSGTYRDNINNHDVYLNMNSYGRIIDSEDYTTGLPVSLFNNRPFNDALYSIGTNTPTIIYTTTSDITFTVGAVGAVTVTANTVNPLSVTSGTDVNVTWYSPVPHYTRKCTCTYEGGSCGSGIGTQNSRQSASSNPYKLTESKTFRVVCDNLP